MYCLILLQFASFLLSSMILIELSLYSAFTMIFQLSVLIPSLFCMFFQISSFSPCFVLKQLHMCCLINIMLLPLSNSVGVTPQIVRSIQPVLESIQYAEAW